MEYGLRPMNRNFIVAKATVLILVLMEYGLRQHFLRFFVLAFTKGLNPCFNGIWSATLRQQQVWRCNTF